MHEKKCIEKLHSIISCVFPRLFSNIFMVFDTIYTMQKHSGNNVLSRKHKKIQTFYLLLLCVCDTFIFNGIRYFKLHGDLVTE
jgi:hypothetical protein